MIAVVDYGASNVRSVLRALRAVGAEPILAPDPEVIRRADRVVVPGVGNFAPAARRLEQSGLAEAVREVARSGRPLLGICLGLQLFLEASEEAPGVPGLGLLPGRVVQFQTPLPVPHVGWAMVLLTEHGKLHSMLPSGLGSTSSYFYHAHSFHPEYGNTPAELAVADYGAPFPTVMGRENVLGVQFHPEKSQSAGLSLLRAFTRWTP